jgi:hypothetical protein
MWMACKLAKSQKSGVDFEGNAADQIQLGVSSDSAGATIVAAVYDGTTLAAPWKFALTVGSKFLTVLVDNPIPRDWTTIEEICNGAKNSLKHYPFDPYGPTQTFIIEAH